MRYVVLMLAVVLAGCASSDGVELDVAATRDGDTVTVEVDTNLPDGAVLSWTVFADDENLVRGDDITVSGGTANGTVGLDGLDPSDVEVGFLPGYRAQPDSITGRYDPDDGVNETVPVS